MEAVACPCHLIELEVGVGSMRQLQDSFRASWASPFQPCAFADRTGGVAVAKACDFLLL